MSASVIHSVTENQDLFSYLTARRKYFYSGYKCFPAPIILMLCDGNKGEPLASNPK